MLQNGDQAPNFTGKDQYGKVVSLADFKGKKLVLYFYPKDDTPGCTKEACNLRDNYNEMMEKGFAILGVSPDDEQSHQRFANKYALPFPLLSDPELKIIKAYGAWGEKNMYGKKYEGLLRTTFIINEEGIINKVIRKVKTDDHTNQILKLYN
ncbi:MAG: thioredoxin-dependent thiol peroxidase [Bacteroidales bacterium]|jgi:peroxiredoxin Q/BCP|nr:thioredoxin-dependent thiol peroxidase [Bacteroidales bacterium]HOI33408.1 thioredoxin-dependent thiol peroxidase [Bacteroidales bacterium]